MNERINECLDEWMNGWMIERINEFCRPHLPKVLWDPKTFNDFFVKSSSRYSLVHILPTSSSKSAPNPSVFCDFMWNRALARVSCTFSQTHLPKEVWTPQFFNIFTLQSCADRGRNHGNRDPTSATTEAILQEKTQSFAPKNVFKPEFTRSRPVTLPNYLMVTWLTWWCGWHDGENAAHDNLGSFLTKLHWNMCIWLSNIQIQNPYKAMYTIQYIYIYNSKYKYIYPRTKNRG